MQLNKVIKFNPIFCGKVENSEWNHFLWNISINGEFFTYKTGLGHFTSIYKNCKRGVYYGRRNKKPDNAMVYKPNMSHNSIGWLHKPTLDDTLNCLFLDAKCANESFTDFCGNMGYSDDSIDALEIYRACQKNGDKLKNALGDKFSKIRSYIESLEL